MKLDPSKSYLIEEGADEYKDRELESIGIHKVVAIFLPNKHLKITKLKKEK